MSLHSSIRSILERHRVYDVTLVTHDIMKMLREEFVPAFPLEVQTDMDAILMIVSDATGLRHDIIRSSSQEKEYVQARYMCYTLMRRKGYTQVSVGKYFHRKQETIGHGVRCLKNDLKSDRELYFVWEGVEKAYAEKWPKTLPIAFVGKYERMFS